jgi:hypothetical protein
MSQIAREYPDAPEHWATGVMKPSAPIPFPTFPTLAAAEAEGYEIQNAVPGGYVVKKQVGFARWTVAHVRETVPT